MTRLAVPGSRELPAHGLPSAETLEAIVRGRESGQEFRRLVYSSSSSVYGNQPHYPVSEDVDKHPHSPYGVTKLAAEHMCELYADNYGLPRPSSSPTWARNPSAVSAARPSAYVCLTSPRTASSTP